MTNLSQAIWIETLKARRSKMPLLTTLAFMLAPFAGGFFIFIMKDPELARQAGEAGATAEAGPWRIGLDAPCYMPFMEHSRRRDLREVHAGPEGRPGQAADVVDRRQGARRPERDPPD